MLNMCFALLKGEAFPASYPLSQQISFLAEAVSVDPMLLGLDPFGQAQDKRQIQAKSGRQLQVAAMQAWHPLRAILDPLSLINVPPSECLALTATVRRTTCLRSTI